MKRLFAPKTVFMALVFGTVNALVLAYIADLAVGIWGRPRGVGYGLLGYYYWLGLSAYGFAMTFVFRAIRLRYALLTSLIMMTVPTVMLLPDRGERPFLSVYVGAILMCMALAAWEHYRITRRDPQSRCDANTKGSQS